MAVTKIWDVKSHFHALIRYVEDTEKTSINISDETISTLLEYGVDSLKTEQRLYVTPINCEIENAADIMIVGQFAGDNSLAAVGSTSSVIHLLTNVFMGLS